MEYYNVLVWMMEVFVIGILHNFRNENSNRRMSCSCIGMGLVMGMLYVWVSILEGVGYGNIILFCYYNSNHSSGSSYF